MKEKFIQIPQALRKQIWLRCGGAGMGAAMLLMVLIYSTDWRFMVPCAVAAALCILLGLEGVQMILILRRRGLRKLFQIYL